MSISESIGALRVALENVDPHLEKLDSAEEYVSSAEAQVKTLQDQKAKALDDLRLLKSEQDRVLAQGEAKLAAQHQQAANQIKAHSDRMADLQNIHDELVILINSLQVKHDSLIASMESLKQKILA